MVQNTDADQRYLTLLKHSLTDYIHVDDDNSNLMPLDWQLRRPRTARYHRLLIAALKRFGMVPMQRPLEPDKADRRKLRQVGQAWPMLADTMIGLARLDQLQNAVETVLADGVPGDLLEAGVWRGGASIFMQAVLTVHDARDRCVWVCDSFQGLPPPDPKDPVDTGVRYHELGFLAVSKAQVSANFQKYDLLADNVRFLEGFFEDTLPTAPMSQIAVLRLDGDMYGSTMCALQSLYDRVPSGGFIIIDDYHLKVCEAAVTDFRKEREVRTPIIDIDGSGAYWRKD